MTIFRRIERSLRVRLGATQSTAEICNNSTGYKILDETSRSGADGWQDAAVAERQHQAFIPLLNELRCGRPREDFVAAARAIERTKMDNPAVVEVGCGSGYYSEALPLLLTTPIRYLGVDYSESMTRLAHLLYPSVSFVTADACRLPFLSESCDILLSGTSLMHIADYRSAIAESARVTRRWCIFHTVPLVIDRATTFLTKQAYGREVVEVIFNRDELEHTFLAHGLAVEAVFDTIRYDVSAILKTETLTLTYLCRKSNGS